MISKTGSCASVGKCAAGMDDMTFSRAEIEQYQLAIDLDDYHEKRFHEKITGYANPHQDEGGGRSCAAV